MHKLFTPIESEENCSLTLKVFLNSAREAIVQRGTDVLTKPEIHQNTALVNAAILEELNICVQHNCFRRRPCRTARNTIDSRWVHKWKYVKSHHDAGKKARIIRARLCLRGFKDREAEFLVNYAGTAGRLSQRLVVSEAVVRSWKLTTIDVKKVFLKGSTYEELAKQTGEPLREFNFDRDLESTISLWQLPRFKGFNRNTVVLGMLKPGTGCVDAPRCFSLKLSRAVADKFGAVPVTYDEQLFARFNSWGELDFIATIHVDDIKVACPVTVYHEFVNVLGSVFGKGELGVTHDNFTNCGSRHTGTNEGYELDQTGVLKGVEINKAP